MSARKRKIVLYEPQQVDESLGLPASKDFIPLELMCIAGHPVADGYEVVIIDGNLYSPDEAHRRVVEACEGAMLYATTGILGFQVWDSWSCSKKVKAKHPKLPMIIGGWFASVKPELQLQDGLYDAVGLAQGEITFRDVVAAIDSGVPLDKVPGLALWRDGQVVKTEPRRIVGWDEIAPVPWHLIDIEPYRVHQMRANSAGDVLRMPSPLAMGSNREPYFGVTYFSSYGCPEPCTFCCSPEVTSRRWKAIPADRLLDDLQQLKERWGFQVLRFHDANFGVQEKRVRAFAQGLIDRKIDIYWNAFIETHSILSYDPATIDLMAQSGMYIAEIGAEAGTDDMMRKIGKPIKGDDNIAAAYEMEKRGIVSSVTYIIGYPNESPESMLSTIDQCRRLHLKCPLARPTVWPYRPIPGTQMFGEAIALGYEPPNGIREWGSIGEYHLHETWPGRIPKHVRDARRLYQYHTVLDYGLARGKRGFWEKRAARRLARNTYMSLSSRLEASFFNFYLGLSRKFFGRKQTIRTFIDPGHRTGTAGNKHSLANPDAVSPVTVGK